LLQLLFFSGRYVGSRICLRSFKNNFEEQIYIIPIPIKQVIQGKTYIRIKQSIN
jgi:hypothetical protein